MFYNWQAMKWGSTKFDLDSKHPLSFSARHGQNQQIHIKLDLTVITYRKHDFIIWL